MILCQCPRCGRMATVELPGWNQQIPAPQCFHQDPGGGPDYGVAMAAVLSCEVRP